MRVYNQQSMLLWRRLAWVVGILAGLVFVLALTIFARQAEAANAPSIITYQGKILENSVAVTTTKAMKFVLYDAATGGNVKYSAAGTVGSPSTISITPVSGIFTINLGGSGTNSLDPDIFKDNSNIYLEVTVGSEVLTPRKQLTAYPYAFNSLYASTSSYANNANYAATANYANTASTATYANNSGLLEGLATSSFAKLAFNEIVSGVWNFINSVIINSATITSSTISTANIGNLHVVGNSVGLQLADITGSSTLVYNNLSYNNPNWLASLSGDKITGTVTSAYFANTSSYANNANYAATANYANTAGTSTYSYNANTSSYALTSTYAYNSDRLDNYHGSDFLASSTMAAGVANRVAYYAADGKNIGYSSAIIISGAQVGVNTTALDSNSALTVSGNIFAQNSVGAQFRWNSAGLMVKSVGGTKPVLDFNSGSNEFDFRIQQTGTRGLEFLSGPSSTNQISRIKIDDNGHVGIGNSSPSSTLDVTGDINLTGALKINNNNLSQYFITATGSAGYVLRMNASSTGYEWYQIPTAASGNGVAEGNVNYFSYYKQINIGDTTSSVVVASNDLYYDSTNGRIGVGNSAPSVKFDVTGAGKFSSDLTVGGNLAITGGISAATVTSTGSFYGNNLVLASGGAITIGSTRYSDYFIDSGTTSGKFWVSTGAGNRGAWTTFAPVGLGSSGQLAYYAASGSVVTGTSAIFINGSNIGIGTTTASSKLTVSGDVNLTGNILLNGKNYSQYFINATGTEGYVWRASSTGFGYWAPATGGGGGSISTSTAGYVAIYSDIDGNISTTVTGTNAMIIDDAGHVMIGTTTPYFASSTATTSTLTVKGALYADHIYTSGNSFYMNGQKIIGTNSTDLNFYADSGQNMKVQAINGSLQMFTTGNGNVELRTDNNGDIRLISTNNLTMYSTGTMNIGTKNSSALNLFTTNNNLTITAGGSGNNLRLIGSNIYLTGQLYDAENSKGSVGQFLQTTATGTRWSTPDGSGTVNSGGAGNVAYYAATGTVVMGNNSMFINSSTGYVGIQNNNPTVPLTVGPNPTTAYNSNELLQLSKSGDAYMTVYDGTARFLLGSTGGTAFLGTQNDTPFTIRVNNTARVYFTGSSYSYNVGIGASTPLSKISIAGNAAIGSGYANTYAAPADGLLVQGNVGIGTTSPNYKLSIVGDVNASGTYYMNGKNYGQYFIDDPGAVNQVWTSNGSGRGQWLDVSALPIAGAVGTSTQGYLAYYDSDGANVTGTPAIFVSSTNGLIGVGTLVPTYRLHVVGGDNSATGPVVALTGSSQNQTESGRIRFTEDATYQGAFISYNGSSNILNIGVHDNTDTSSTNDYNSISIKRLTGYVGIGTTTPAYPLTVSGNMNLTGNLYLNGTNYSQWFINSGTTTANLVWASDGTGTHGKWVRVGDIYTATTTGGTPGGSSGYIQFNNGSGGFGGSSNLFWDNTNGRLGIGTTTPDYKLDLYGGTSDTNSQMRITGNGDVFPGYRFRRINGSTKTNREWSYFVGSDGAFQLQDVTGGKNIFTVAAGAPGGSLMVSSSGYVGIGTSTPTYKLSVYSDTDADVQAVVKTDSSGTSARSRIAMTNSTGNYLTLSMNGGSYSAATSLFSSASNASIRAGTSGGLTIGNEDANGYVNFYTGGIALANERMRITKDGNIGIGTTSPYYDLHMEKTVNGQMLAVFQNDSTNAAAQSIIGVGTTGAFGGIYSQGSNFVSSQYFQSNGITLYASAATTNGLTLAASAGPIRFVNGGVERMTISSTTGYIGIATTSPVYPLTVSGTTYISQDLRLAGKFFDSSNSAGTSGYILQSTATGTNWVSTSSLGIIGSASAAGSTGQIQFNNSGALGATSSLYWDNTNGRLGIGTTTPNRKLTVYNPSSNATDLNVAIINDANYGAYLNLQSNSNYLGNVFTGSNRQWVFGMFGTDSFKIHDNTSSTDPLVVEAGAASNSIYVKANGFIGIGTSTPAALLDIKSSSALAAGAASVNLSGDNNTERFAIESSQAPVFQAGKYNGTDSSRSAILKNDVLGYFQAGGYNGSTMRPNEARMMMVATENHSTTKNGARIDFQTTPNGSGYNSIAIRMTIDQNGNVGIGTTTPDKTFTVWGTGAGINLVRTGGSEPYILLNNGDISGGNYSTGFQIRGIVNSGTATSGLRFTDAVAGAEWMRITAAGNVGIGTAAPGNMLTVSTTASNPVWINGSNFANGFVINGTLAAAQYSGMTLLKNGTEKWFVGIDGANTNNDFVIRSSGSVNPFSIISSGTVANTMVLKAGNVGIGTSTPSALLDVNGVTRVMSTLSTPSAGAGVEIAYNTSTGVGRILAYDRTGSVYKSLGLGTDSGVQLYLSSVGNVGIGTSSPSYPLTVSGTAYISADLRLMGGLCDSTGAVGANGQILSTNGTSTKWITLNSGSAASGNEGYIQFAGTVAGTFNATSSLSYNTSTGVFFVGDYNSNIVASSTAPVTTVTKVALLESGNTQYFTSERGNTIGQLVLAENPWKIGVTYNLKSSYTFTGSGEDRYRISGMSKDGKYIFYKQRSYWGGGERNYDFYSSNYGTSFTKTAQTGDVSDTEASIGVSADGKTMVKTSGSGIYMSYDYGVTWYNVFTMSHNTNPWALISSDGKVVVVKDSAGTHNQMYISQDSGKTWVTRYVPVITGSSYGRMVAISGNGKIIALTLNAGYSQNSPTTSISRDYGVTWTNVAPSSTKNFYAIYINADGSKMYAHLSDGYMYYSNNYGANWTKQTSGSVIPTPDIYSNCDLSDSGQVVACPSATNGSILVSQDYGVTFTTTSFSLVNGSDYTTKIHVSNNGNIINVFTTRDYQPMMYTLAATTYNLSNYVGIGTTAPTSPLTVSGATSITGATTITGAATIASGNLTWNSAGSDSYGAIFGTSTRYGRALTVISNTTTPTASVFSVGSSTSPYNFTVLNNGNVGIGTSSPDVGLTVAGGFDVYNFTGGAFAKIKSYAAAGHAGFVFDSSGVGYNSMINFRIGGSPYGSFGIDSSDSYKFKFTNNDWLTGTNLLTITQTGNVGIGTTTPTYPLTVSGTTYISQDLMLSGRFFDSAGLPGTNGYVLQSTATGTNWVSTSSLGIIGSASAAGSTGQLQFNDSGVLAATSGLYWDNTTGRLGVGTSSPISILDVQSASVARFTTKVNTTLSTPQSAIQIGLGGSGPFVAGSGPSFLFFAPNSGQVSSYLGRLTSVWENSTAGSEAAGMVFNVRKNSADTTASTEAMRITSAGNVGIGTSVPTSTLSVLSSVSSGNIFQVGTTTAQNILTVGADGNMAVGTSSTSILNSYTNNSYGRNLSITDNGTTGLLLNSTKADGDNVIVGDLIGSITSNNVSGRLGRVGMIRFQTDGSTTNDRGGAITFFTKNDGSTISEKMRITNTGNVGIGTTTPSYPLTVSGTMAVATYGNAGLTFINTKMAPHMFAVANGGNITGGIGGNQSDYGGIAVTGYKNSGGTTPAVYLSGFMGINTPTVAPVGFYSRKLDSSTGYMALANNEKIFSGYNDSTEVFTILGNGSVGIGTTSPAYKLEVTSASNTIARFIGSYTGIQGIRVERNGGDNVRLTANYLGYGGGLESSSSLRFAVNNNDISSPSLFINTNGNVGVGTVSPSAKLTVAAADATTTNILSINTAGNANDYWAISNSTGVSGYFIPVFTIKSDVTNWGAGNTGDAANAGFTVLANDAFAPSGKGALHFDARNYTNTGTLAYKNLFSFGSYNNIKMVMAASGNVGIGTTTPAYPLTVSGTTYISQDLKLTGAFYDSTGLSGTKGYVLQSTATGTNWVSTSSLGIVGSASAAGLSGQIQFNDSGALGASSSLYWDNTNFRLGIGTSTPSQRLEVNGYIYSNRTAGDPGFWFNKGDAGVVNTIWGAINTGVGTGSNRFSIGNNSTVGLTGFNEKFVILENGNVGIGTSTPTNLLELINNQDGQTRFYIKNGSSTSNAITSISVNSDLGGGGIFAPSSVYGSSANFTPGGMSLYAGSTLTGGLTIGAGSTSTSNMIRFSISGVERSRFNYLGYFGIGTTVPTSTLSVLAATSTGSLFQVGTTTNPNLLTVLANGNVGIGTSSPAYQLHSVKSSSNDFGLTTWSSTASSLSSLRLQHYGATGGSTPDSSRLGGILFSGISTNGTAYTSGLIDSYIGTNSTTNAPGDLRFHTSDGATLTERMRINSAGYVGIGTTTPRRLLELYGTDARLVMTVSNQTTDNKSWLFGPSSSTFYIKATSDDLLSGSNSFGIARSGYSSYTYTFDNGNVGIGTSSPAYPLTVSGTPQFTGIANSNYYVCVDDSGALYSSSAACSGSDERLKSNITSMGSVLSKVMSLKPVTYNWKNGDSNAELGFIAQDMQQYFPELVAPAFGNYLGIKYDKLTAVLAKAIQEQQTEIQSFSSLNNNIVIGSSTTSTDLTVAGNLKVIKNVEIKGHAYFSDDSIGKAKILSGADTTHISFAEQYAMPPIVTISPLDFVGAEYRVGTTTVSGFDIVLSTSSAHDVSFNWHAFATNKLKVHISDGNVVIIYDNDNKLTGTTATSTLPSYVNPDNTDPSWGPVGGCTNPLADNYNPNATDDDGSCVVTSGTGVSAGDVTTNTTASNIDASTPTESTTISVDMTSSTQG